MRTNEMITKDKIENREKNMHVGTGNLRANQPVAFRVANEEQLCFFPYIYKEIKGNSSKYTQCSFVIQK